MKQRQRHNSEKKGAPQVDVEKIIPTIAVN
jgi:hypothetical protein